MFWYDQDENGAQEEHEDNYYFVGDAEKFRAMEETLDQARRR
jgi:hypothetical protein